MTWSVQDLPDDHRPVKSGMVGVLLVNLGTPDAAEPGAVKRYLKQFLSDPRVVELPKLVWQPVLRGIILNTRPQKSALAYAKVWGDRGSPLADITARQAEAISGAFGANVQVDYAMRYGNPSIESRLLAMKEGGCDRIVIAPLYPQYCAATTATVFDEVARILAAMRWQPSVRFLPPYYDDPVYINALADDLTRQMAGMPFQPEVMLLSFHGMPQRTHDLGDPYYCHCQKTARLVQQAVTGRPEFSGVRFEVTFQSRFGRAQWLEPATDAVLTGEAGRGTKRLVVAAPGFSADCVETLEELALEGRDQFIEAGGEDYAVLECLNTSADGVAMLKALVGREISGWA